MSRRNATIAALVGVVVFVAGALVVWSANHREAPVPVLTPLVPEMTEPPDTHASDIDGEQLVSAETAITTDLLPPEVAAVRMLELTEDVVALSPGEAAALQRSISTEGSADHLAAEVSDLITALRAEVPDGVVAHVAPLGVWSRETASGWEVSIWYVEVLVHGEVLAVEQWRTATYSLELEAGEWRMDQLRSTDGPTPTRLAGVAPTPVDSFTALTAKFDDGVLVP